MTLTLHQGAQPPCCNFDAVYMAATEITPASTEKPLPRGSHPYMMRQPAHPRGPPCIHLCPNTLGGELAVRPRGGRQPPCSDHAVTNQI